MKKLIPIKNHIIFQFVDEVDSKGRFVETTNWGFHLNADYANSAQTPRWANVVSVGPECKNVKPGQQILVRALKWTAFFKLNDSRYWRTDENQCVATRDSATTTDLNVLENNVVFIRVETKARSTIEIVGDLQDTPTGRIILLGNKCSKELSNGTKIYFNGQNFFDNFKHNQQNLCFIAENEILAYEPAE